MVVDTNIIIACLNAEQKAVAALSGWKEEGRIFFISSVSVAETLALKGLTDFELTHIKAFLKNFTSIAFDDEVAEMAAFFRRTYNLEVPDAAIAATAFKFHMPLVTRDRQFLKISEISIVQI